MISETETALLCCQTLTLLILLVVLACMGMQVITINVGYTLIQHVMFFNTMVDRELLQFESLFSIHFFSNQVPLSVTEK